MGEGGLNSKIGQKSLTYYLNGHYGKMRHIGISEKDSFSHFSRDKQRNKKFMLKILEKV